jgi:BirA family transcriptional regulator, biotin operon repressor / biotin---[acetyl-CoA-carboxylase] ligase
LYDVPPFSLALATSHLGEAARHFALEVVDECASTNDVLGARAPSTGPMQVLLARRQTAGRGRRGRQWLSAPSQGLTFSCALFLSPGAPPPNGMSLAVGLAVAQALEALGARSITLKWPNDVLAGGAKLAGILIELSSGQQRTRSAVIGVGINLRAAPAALPPGATALAHHIQTLPTDEQVLAQILLHLRARVRDFETSGFAGLRDAWQTRDAYSGRKVRISGDTHERIGLCDGVDHDGALLLRDSAGTHRIFSGEVSLRPEA